MTPIEIVNKANQFFEAEFKAGRYNYELAALAESLEEHEYCYSIAWCLKSDLEKALHERTVFGGGGPLMISKISDEVEMAGSAPTVDWVREFELKIRGLEAYWCLEIQYEKQKIGSIKSLLKLSTPEVLQLVNDDSKIEIEGEIYELEPLMKHFEHAGIECVLELREREKNNNES